MKNIVDRLTVQLFGLLLLGFGLFLKYGLPKIVDMYLGSFLGQSGGNGTLADAGIFKDLGLVGVTFDDVLSGVNEMLNLIITVHIAVGVFLLAVGLFGCCGACCSVRILLAAVWLLPTALARKVGSVRVIVTLG